MKTSVTAPAAAVLFETFLANGEIAGKADCVAFLKDHGLKLTASELQAAWHAAANRFVDSMASNEVDTVEAGDVTREDAISRIARWEAMRPAAGCPVMPGEWIAAVRHAVARHGSRAKSEIRMAWNHGYPVSLRVVDGSLQRMRNSVDGHAILEKMTLATSFSDLKLRMEDWACKVGDALRRYEESKRPAAQENPEQEQQAAPAVEAVKPLTKEAALKIYADVAKLKYTSPVTKWQEAFPDREALAKFRAETGSLTWGENYGQSPWENAFSLAWDCGNGLSDITAGWLTRELDSPTEWHRKEAVAHVNLLRLYRAPGLPEALLLKAGLRPLPVSQENPEQEQQAGETETPAPPVDPRALAIAFVSKFSLKQRRKIDRANASLPDDVCASHDICDANEVMAEAFKDLTGRNAETNSMHGPDDCGVWSEAWGIAKREGFEALAAETPAPAPVPMNKVLAGMGQKAAEYHASKTRCDLHSSPRWHTSRMLRPQDKLAHLLCDLMHHAERDGIDFENTLAVARSLRFTGKRLDDA